MRVLGPALGLVVNLMEFDYVAPTREHEKGCSIYSFPIF